MLYVKLSHKAKPGQSERFRDEEDLFLKHGAVIGHVQHQLDLLFLLELGLRPIVGSVDLHLPPPAFDLVARPRLERYKMMHLKYVNQLTSLFLCNVAMSVVYQP